MRLPSAQVDAKKPSGILFIVPFGLVQRGTSQFVTVFVTVRDLRESDGLQVQAYIRSA
jgi:hypothetical protein